MIEKKLRDKIEELIASAPAHAEVNTETDVALGMAWVTEAVNVVRLALPDPLQTLTGGISSWRRAIPP
jgi:hypothetical protein